MELTVEQKKILDKINQCSMNGLGILEYKIPANLKLVYAKPGELTSCSLIISIPERNNQINDGLSLLASYLNFLTQLENDGYILVYNSSNIPPRGEMVVELSDNIDLRKQAEVLIADSKIVAQIDHFMHKVEATDKLRNFIKNGYKTKEEKSASLKFWGSFWVTLVGAIAAIVAAVAACLAIPSCKG